MLTVACTLLVTQSWGANAAPGASESTTGDAIGVAGPTTDILIDVVGHATGSRLQELAADVASKASATQTVSFSGRDLTDGATFQTGTSNGCTVDLNGRSGRLSLEIPIGATILSITGAFYDDSGSSVYTATLLRITRTASGDAVPIECGSTEACRVETP